MDTKNTAHESKDARYQSFPVDVFENKKEFLLVADLPGVLADKLDVSFEDGDLTISAERPAPSREGRIYGNRGFGRARRTFSLPETVDASRIEASYKDGVLSLRLPKTERALARRVPVVAS